MPHYRVGDKIFPLKIWLMRSQPCKSPYRLSRARRIIGSWNSFFFLIGIHSMQGGTATTWHGVTKKEAEKIKT